MKNLERLGLRPVINATGPWTKMGNSTPSESVRRAMEEAAQSFMPYAELQESAASVISEVTGSESGYVTSGAASALTLAVAACIAGEDPDRIRSLPHPTPPDTVVLFEQHRWAYDIALRSTGARLRTVDAFAADALRNFSEALDNDVACAFYDCTGLPYRDPTGVPPLSAVVDLAHRKGKPVVVDASMALPPASNLTELTGTGADAIAFSGGKAIQGPPASGFVACRRNLVRSIALQHQDVNVYAELTGIVDPRKLYMGLARSHKVGKEQIVGLLVALQEYARCDHGAIREAWRQRLRIVEKCVASIPGIAMRWLESEERAPYLMIGFDGPLSDVTPPAISKSLLDGEPRIFCAAHRGNALWLGAETMTDKEAEAVGRRIADIVQNWKSSGRLEANR